MDQDSKSGLAWWCWLRVSHVFELGLPTRTVVISRQDRNWRVHFYEEALAGCWQEAPFLTVGLSIDHLHVQRQLVPSVSVTQEKGRKGNWVAFYNLASQVTLCHICFFLIPAYTERRVIRIQGWKSVPKNFWTYFKPLLWARLESKSHLWCYFHWRKHATCQHLFTTQLFCHMLCDYMVKEVAKYYDVSWRFKLVVSYKVIVFAIIKYPKQSEYLHLFIHTHISNTLIQQFNLKIKITKVYQ